MEAARRGIHIVYTPEYRTGCRWICLGDRERESQVHTPGHVATTKWEEQAETPSTRGPRHPRGSEHPRKFKLREVVDAPTEDAAPTPETTEDTMRLLHSASGNWLRRQGRPGS